MGRDTGGVGQCVAERFTGSVLPGSSGVSAGGETGSAGTCTKEDMGRKRIRQLEIWPNQRFAKTFECRHCARMQVDPADEAWYKAARAEGQFSPGKRVKRKEVPPEPVGFRAWLRRTYPNGDHSISWAMMRILHPDIIKEFAQGPSRFKVGRWDGLEGDFHPPECGRR